MVEENTNKETLSRQEELKKAQEKLTELLNLEEVKKLINNNQVEFEYKNETYRVSKPSFKQKQEVYRKRCERHAELLQETKLDGKFKYLVEKDLIEIYKKRGIDIDKIVKEVTILATKEKGLLDKLGKALIENQSNPELEAYRIEIDKLRTDITNLITEKNTLLECSIESQLLTFIYNFFAHLVTEKKIVVVGQEPKWEKAWKTFDEFLEADESLIGIASTYMTMLINDQIE
jgi:hypothetical protein